MSINRIDIETTLAHAIARCCSIVMPYRIISYLTYFNNKVYSAWLCNILGVDMSNIFMKGQAIVGHNNIYIGKNNVFRQNVMLSAWASDNGIEPRITIGDGCDFGRFNHITCANKVTIGNCVLTGMFVLITDNFHGDTKMDFTPPLMRPLVSKGAVVIEDNVWIGDKVSILPGVHIGEGAIIGANSVVTKDIPRYTVAAGSPAKVIKNMLE